MPALGITKPRARARLGSRSTVGHVTGGGSRSRPTGGSTACLRTSPLGLRLDVVTVSRLASMENPQSWGRTGFDEDNKAMVARRVLSTRKTGRLRNLPADNNGYALAA